MWNRSFLEIILGTYFYMSGSICSIVVAFVKLASRLLDMCNKGMAGIPVPSRMASAMGSGCNGFFGHFLDRTGLLSAVGGPHLGEAVVNGRGE